jgi:tetratricopeptide (TPR) repeat protein
LNSAWQRFSAAAAAALAVSDFAGARAALHQAVAQRADDADGWFNLGYCCRQLGDFGGALDAYASALAAGLRDPEAAHVNRAVILADHLNRSAQAEAELRQAIAIAPDFLPAWLNLGQLHEDRGAAEEARAAYVRALTIAPQNGRAQARLAALTVEAGDAAGAVAALEARCRAGLMRDADAADILFALGNAYDAAQQYDAAFEAIMAANNLNASLRQHGQRYDPAQMEALVAALIAGPVAPASAAPQHRERQDEPLFICGMFRSGSTVFEQLLARHPDVAAGGELEAIPALVHAHARPYPERLWALSEAELNGLRADYDRSRAALGQNARIVTDKRPDNFLHIALIKRLFPAAKIVVTRRAPLDNLLSILFLNFADTISYSDDIGHIVHYMQQYERLMAHWARVYGDDIRFVDYEQVVRDPDAVLAGIHDWIGLSPLVDGAAKAPPTIRTPSNWQARGPLHQRSVDRWRRFERALEPYRAILAGLPRA